MIRVAAKDAARRGYPSLPPSCVCTSFLGVIWKLPFLEKQSRIVALRTLMCQYGGVNGNPSLKLGADAYKYLEEFNNLAGNMMTAL